MRVLSEHLCRFLDAEGMYRDIFGIEPYYLVHSVREELEIIVRQTCDEVDVDRANARTLRDIVSLVELADGVVSSHGAKHVLAKTLRIYADSRNAVLLGNSELLLGDGIGSACLKRILVEG